MRAALWCYAWDLAAGADEFMARTAAMGINQLNIAGTYHAGWFLHPNARSHRAYMPEDGVCYFRPRQEFYAGTRIKPQMASLCSTTDWLEVACERANAHGLDIVSWTIGCHNTLLGTRHPECAVTNCFGDTYPHALCPAHPEVSAYLEALCGDLSHNFSLHAIQTESFGYLGWRHGHHHERDLTGLTDAESRLMNLCFHPHTRQKAEAAGIDARKLQADVRELLNTAMESAPDRPDGFPAMWQDFCARLPELQPYLVTCRETERTVVKAVREAMSPATELHLGGYDAALANQATTFATAVYGQSPEQASATVARAREAIPATHRLNVGMRLGCGVPTDQLAMRRTLAALAAAGADTVIFYNASESPPAMLRWIGPALEGLDA